MKRESQFLVNVTLDVRNKNIVLGVQLKLMRILPLTVLRSRRNNCMYFAHELSKKLG